MYSCTFSVLEFPTRMSFRRVINYHRIIEFSWLSEPPLPRAPHFRRRRGKFQAGLVAIKRKNGIDRLRFALVRPRQIRVIIYLTSPVRSRGQTNSNAQIATLATTHFSNPRPFNSPLSSPLRGGDGRILQSHHSIPQSFSELIDWGGQTQQLVEAALADDL